MLTISAISGTPAARDLATIRAITGEPLSLIRQRTQSGEVFMSCPYPRHQGALAEFVGAAQALNRSGLVLEIRELWPSGESRLITLSQLENLVELDHEIEQVDEDFVGS